MRKLFAIEYMHKNGIAIEAWYPLGGRDFNKKE